MTEVFPDPLLQRIVFVNFPLILHSSKFVRCLEEHLV